MALQQVLDDVDDHCRLSRPAANLRHLQRTYDEVRVITAAPALLFGALFVTFALLTLRLLSARGIKGRRNPAYVPAVLPPDNLREHLEDTFETGDLPPAVSEKIA